jgi:hypothetical protein
MAPSPPPATKSVLRALNEPRPVPVKTNARGEPVRIGHGSQARQVAEILDHWRLDDLFWRPKEQFSRLYYSCRLENGDVVTVFHERRGEGAAEVRAWYRQRYDSSQCPTPSGPDTAGVQWEATLKRRRAAERKAARERERLLQGR